jgi:hypothetical protein
MAVSELRICRHLEYRERFINQLHKRAAKLGMRMVPDEVVI